MLDALRPFTVLVGAFAAWCLGLLVLALVGLGGRVAPLPSDPSLAPPVPVLRFADDAPRLGASNEYLAAAERPLFMPDRRPAPVAVVASGPQAPFEGVLTSVLLTDGLKMAVFSENNGQTSTRVRLGESVPGSAWRVASIAPRQVVLEGPEGQRVLDLRIFDGQGGQAPTPIASAAPKPASADAAAPMAAAPMSGSAAPAEPVAPEAQRSAEDQAQIDAIRARIEARRAQLRQQQERNANAPVAEQ